MINSHCLALLIFVPHADELLHLLKKVSKVTYIHLEKIAKTHPGIALYNSKVKQILSTILKHNVLHILPIVTTVTLAKIWAI